MSYKHALIDLEGSVVGTTDEPHLMTGTIYVGPNLGINGKNETAIFIPDHFKPSATSAPPGFNEEDNRSGLERPLIPFPYQDDLTI